MQLSDLCPVTFLICLALMFSSESTVTDVVQTQFLVRCPGGTPYNGLYGEAPPERGTFFRLRYMKG